MQTRMISSVIVALALVPVAAPATDDETSVSAALGRGIEVKRGDLFKATLRARGQFRVEGSATEGEDPAAVFSVRRLRASLKASALDELVDLVIQLSFAPRDLEPDQPSPLRDANATVNLHRDVRVRVGQMKVPFDRQRMTSSSSLAFPERSVAVNALTLDRDIGAYWLSDDLFGAGILKAQVGVFSGDGRNRLNTDLGLLSVARVQVAPLGNFDDLDEVTFDRAAPFRFAVAGAVAFNDDTPRERSTIGDYTLDARADFVHATVDVLARTSGLTGFGAALVRVATAVEGQDTATSGVGGVVQLGGLITDHVEVVGRVSRFHPLPREWLMVPNPADTLGSTEIRPGMNLYVHEHDVKLQATVGVTVLDDLTRTADGMLQLQLFL